MTYRLTCGKKFPSEPTSPGIAHARSFSEKTMGKIYRVGSFYETQYFNTAKEADKFKPDGEEPETFVRVDAAAECNRMQRYMEESERLWWRARKLLEELRNASSVEVVLYTDIGRQVN